jgi:drug/metabolite transporter (DMT)-like permease
VLDPSRWRGYAMVVAAACCWGGMSILARLLLRDQSVGPLVLVAIRAYLATVTVFAAAAALRPACLRIERRHLWLTAVIGLAGFAANNFLYFEALHLTNVATALLLQYQAPVLVALYSVLVQRQPLRGRIILALALALVGCSLVVRAYDPEMLRPNLLGVMAGLGTACTFAFYILASRAALRSLDAWTLLAYGYFSASLFWSAVIPPWKILGYGFSLGVWITFLAIATVGTVLPFGLFIGGLKFLLPTQAGIVGMLEPVVAATAAFVVLGETLVPLQILGGGLVLAGVVMVQTT